jgi:signal transduction histidine kinase
MVQPVLDTIIDPARLTLLQHTELLDSPPEEAFDRFTRLASKLLHVPIAMVSLVDKDRQFFKSVAGPGEPLLRTRETPLSHSFCRHVVAAGAPFVVTDAREHPLVRDNPAVRDLGVVAYAGLPLTVPSGQTIGSFCAIDQQPRMWTPEELALLQSLATAVMTEIELRLTARQLRDNYRQMQVSETLRADLVHMAVHDLRTPLTTLISGLYLVQEAGTLNDLQAECLTTALRGAETLLAMINDMLDVNKMEAGQQILVCAELAPAQVVTRALEQVAQLANDRGLTLTTDLALTLPTLVADVDKLQRTLVNLLGNALKFTPPGGRVTVAAHASADTTTVHFSVTDTGPGIPREAFDHIFEKFGQVAMHHTTGQRSTGLGLTFCKMVVEAHGGRIWVDSELGKGSTLAFTLPCRPPPAPAEPLRLDTRWEVLQNVSAAV